MIPEMDRVHQHLLALGFNKSMVGSFCKTLTKQIEESGVEWVVQRLKTLKLYHNQQLGGEIPTVPKGWAVYHTRSRSVFKDPMVRMVMDLPNSGDSLLRKEGFIRIYQVFVLDVDITEKQRTKFIENVTAPYSGSKEMLENACGYARWGVILLTRDCSGLLDRVKNVKFTPLRLTSPSVKKSPVLKRNKRTSLVKYPIELVSASRTSVLTHNFNDAMTLDFKLQSLWRTYPQSVSDCMVGPGGEFIPVQSPNGLGWSGLHEIPAGKVAYIQEGGCKLRSVANPLMAIQALGNPLKRKLEEITRSISQVGTFNQSMSHDTIVRWLCQGREVASYDLTAFTDRFPFAIQEAVLLYLLQKGLITRFDHDVMKLVVEKSWTLPDSPSQVKWEVGQPLGFNPSFHLATLTHCALLRGMGCVDFCVVGDDIAIGDRTWAKRYEEMIQSLGVEIQYSKSIISDQFAEFCGKILTREGVNPSTKVRLLNKGADQLVKILDFYGMQAYSFLSLSEQKEALKAVLPLDLGGLGMQLPGMSYQEYLKLLNTDAISESRLVRALQDLLGLPYKDTPDLIQWLSLFDHDNSLIQKRMVLQQCNGYTPKGVTGISASNLLFEGHLTPNEEELYLDRKDTIFDFVDDSTREFLSRYSMLTEWMKFQYFDQYGYITEHRKFLVFQATDINWSSENDVKRQDRYIRFFHQRRHTPKGKEGHNKPTKE